ncbi:5-formyltetrahydrofolate cyclo-ligase [Salmonirosea aquatica]|uniref:5-formyltetrahydrofolate cyclo-ligase n=1 Tax=Salmonirosea aquatica TaxID=2654236 RepID=UPI0035715E27
MTKQQSRVFFLEERAKLTPAETEHLSRLIAGRLFHILTERSVRYLHSFLGADSRQEVDTRLLRQLLQTKIPALDWATPRIIPGTRRMEHYVWDDTTVFSVNRWGIDEPDASSAQIFDLRSIDAVLVPLLAYDRQGNRAGYGGGYYDRFLAECRSDTLKIGLSFFEPIDAISDVNAWDIRLDFCVTPFAVHRWDY